MFQLKTIIIACNFALISVLIFFTFYYKSKSSDLAHDIKIQKLHFEAQIKDIELQSAIDMNEEYIKMDEALKEQQEAAKKIKAKTKVKIVKITEIVEVAKKNNNCLDAWRGANSDWGMPTKD